jgi:hypothetical protein
MGARQAQGAALIRRGVFLLGRAFVGKGRLERDGNPRSKEAERLSF